MSKCSFASSESFIRALKLKISFYHMSFRIVLFSPCSFELLRKFIQLNGKVYRCVVIDTNVIDKTKSGPKSKVRTVLLNGLDGRIIDARTVNLKSEFYSINP